MEKSSSISASPNSAERLIRVGCPAHNCGGRCLLVAHVSNGKITRLDADDRPDLVSSPQLRGCARGRSYLQRQYHPDRLLYPLKRVGKRGEGRFERITWDEALDTVAGEMQRVKDTYGNSALYVPYGTGSFSNTNGAPPVRRLLNLFGGRVDFYGNYSLAATQAATPTVYGTEKSGNQRLDWMNTRYVLMWGWNPAEMRDDTNSDYYLRLAHENGARVVCIDPRMNMSVPGLADEWVPIRPGTDTAMMSAMAYVLISEGLYDAEFVRTHCSGFDASQMPADAESEESYLDYILGTRDGTPKTPRWAEAITGVPAEKIVEIARDYGTIKPAMLYQGYGMQRRAYGEQVVRAGCVLAAITGNVGIPGGWASGVSFPADEGPVKYILPEGENPVKTKIPVFLWSEAVLHGSELSARQGVTGADHLDNPIKLIYAVASNCLINQHANVNRSAEILRDENLVEFLVVQDNFLTPTGRFADIILPACTQFETWGIEGGVKYNLEVLLMPKLVEPPGETRSDYRICADLAERLGIGAEYTQWRDERGWVAWLLEQLRQTRDPQIPSLDDFEASNIGYYGKPISEPKIAFKDFRQDPLAYPLDTPSGKIEIFSSILYKLNDPVENPPIPKYIQEWDSPFGPEAADYPLQAMGHHTMRRVHSTHEYCSGLEEAFPHRVAMNPLDARARGIKDGDLVKVYNQRGAIQLPCRLSQRIMPGVVDIPQGAWWTPDANGLDTRGAVNMLTSERWTPFAFGNAQHTIMVQIEKTGLKPPASAVHLPNHSQSEPIRRQPMRGTLPAKKQGQLAFYFNASACTGCKSCEAACKDRNQLPLGVQWRRVYEIGGGNWQPKGSAWEQDVFAYNLSLSCNHCEDAICVEVCPTGAMYKRVDGIVLVDQAKCIGCQYCSWACPYDAPQFDAAAGYMTKCTFCVEEIDAGKPPSCVAACPMRALDFGERTELEAKYAPLKDGKNAMFPLPENDLTNPALLVRKHPNAARAEREAAAIANREEV